MPEFTPYFRKPFKVEAVQLTRENIEELAPLIGTLEIREEDGEPFIKVNQNVQAGTWRAYLGFYITKMGDKVRCYSKKSFNQQFVQGTEEVLDAVQILSRRNHQSKTSSQELPQPETVVGLVQETDE